jgi:hypothetical protein
MMALLEVLFSRRLKYSFSSTTTHRAEKATEVGRGKIHMRVKRWPHNARNEEALLFFLLLSLFSILSILVAKRKGKKRGAKKGLLQLLVERAADRGEGARHGGQDLVGSEVVVLVGRVASFVIDAGELTVGGEEEQARNVASIDIVGGVGVRLFFVLCIDHDKLLAFLRNLLGGRKILLQPGM